MQISKNFTLEECVASDTAKKMGIKNIPDPIDRAYISELVCTVLQPIRDAWGESIIINSCFRNSELNAAVGGSKTSDHLHGCAADIRTKSNTLQDNKRLWDLIMQLVNKGVLNCRQIVWEYGKQNEGPRWIHVAINNKFNAYKDNQLVYYYDK